MSHSSMSTAELSLQDFFGAIGQIRLSLERREKREVPGRAARLLHMLADQFKGWPQFCLGKLIHQVVEFITHRAHVSIVSTTPMGTDSTRREVCGHVSAVQCACWDAHHAPR